MRLREWRASDGYARWEKRTDGPLLALAVAFVFVLITPYAISLTGPWAVVVLVANVVIWLAFAIDYVVRLYLAPKRWHFVRTHLLDLAIVLLPMLRPLRALRLLRVLRLGSVAGVAHERATRSLHARVSMYVASAAVVSLLLAGVAVREAERGASDANITSLDDGLWWAATTVTTVGYGDRFPTTTMGRLVALGLMLVGIALLGVITATIAAWFVGRLEQVESQVENVEHRTDATLDEVLTALRRIDQRMNALDSLQAGRDPQTEDP